jgi:hypothetical protein
VKFSSYTSGSLPSGLANEVPILKFGRPPALSPQA